MTAVHIRPTMWRCLECNSHWRVVLEPDDWFADTAMHERSIALALTVRQHAAIHATTHDPWLPVVEVE